MGPTDLRRSRPVSRRDALRYATAVSALAGPRCGSNKRRHPRGGGRAYANQLRHAPDSGAGHPCRRPLRRDQLRLAVASRLVLRRQADHPFLRRFADRRRAGDRQQLPIREAGRVGALGLHPRVRRRRQPTLAPPGSCIPLQAGARVLRSSSPSTTTSTATPGITLHCSGFAESTPCLACSEPASTGESMRASGPPPMVLSGIRARLVAGGPGGPSRQHGQVDPAAVLYQRIVSTASTPGPVVGGLEVDVSDALAQDCGQWNLHP